MEPIDSRFLDVFASRFLADAINLDDPEQVRDEAEATAAFYTLGVPDTRAVREQLSRALDEWTPEVVSQFVDAGDIDWQFNEASTEQLREIVQEIVRWLEQFEANPPVVSA